MKKIRKQTKLWTTKLGEKVRICDMSDSHLDNTIALLERVAEIACQRAISNGYTALCFVSGEMAEEHLWSAITDLEENGLDPAAINPLYDDLILDRERRRWYEYCSNKSTSTNGT